jgi:predicted DNA-binding transcriptional regulator YafY
MADLGLRQPSEAALLKLQAALPAGARERAEFARRRILIDTRGWRDPAESVALLPLVLDALWRVRKLRFLYAREGCDPAGRVGDPLGLVAKGSTWYLVARVEGEIRTYRVSRMREAAALGEPAGRPADFDLAAYWESSAAEFREQLPRYYATFLVEAAVMRWARYRGWRLEEETPDGGRVRIRLRFDIEEEALQFALSFGPDLEVVEPAELRGKVLASAEGILRAAGRLQ